MMTTTLPDPPRPDRTGPSGPPPPAGPRREPARRLSPEPRRDRAWRSVLTILAAVFVVLGLLALAGLSIVSWSANRGFTDVPAVHDLGTPTSVTLSTEIAGVSIVHAEDADQVRVGLVEPGEDTLPPAGTQLRAEVDSRVDGGTAAVDVRQPRWFGPIPWSGEQRDVLLVVPADHELELDVTSMVGDVDLQGEFSQLSVTSDVGAVDVDLAAPVPGGLAIDSSVGDVDVTLAPDAAGDVAITTEVGSVQLRLPGRSRWSIDAAAEVGEVRVDPGVRASDGAGAGAISVRSDVGDVSVTR